MSKKKIIVDIDESGNCSIDGENFVGTECSHFIGEIESVLGTVEIQKDKPEYHQKRTISNKNLQRGRR
jgi:hypothetical protein